MRLMLIRCPDAASRRQGFDDEPQLDKMLTSLEEDEDVELEMNCASSVTRTRHDRLS